MAEWKSGTKYRGSLGHLDFAMIHYPYLGNKKGRRGDLNYLLFGLFYFALCDPLPDFYANENNDYYAVTEEHRGIVLNPSHLHCKQGKRTKSYEYLKN
ncbi:hypothetical protein [Cronobacter sakazakii]|uniref:hypothetical protein n=1 Tax=Cronobacter sakazakii TaxID=28141 RepID=UPI0015E32336|nr:hypothetical protein [Cronobacter sakazakii]